MCATECLAISSNLSNPSKLTGSFRVATVLSLLGAKDIIALRARARGIVKTSQFWRANDNNHVPCSSHACMAGKAGGFLALDWSDGTRLSPLARASYRLHEELAHKFGKERIDYRPVHTLMVSMLGLAHWPGQGTGCMRSWHRIWQGALQLSVCTS